MRWHNFISNLLIISYYHKANFILNLDDLRCTGIKKERVEICGKKPLRNLNFK